MDERTEKAFEYHNGAVLKEIQGRYGIAPDDLKRLGSFESFVFEYPMDGIGRIMRVTPSSHRRVEQIQGELEWVNYLADNGMSVCRGLPSNSGAVVEKIEVPADNGFGESFYTAVSFEKARGARAGKDDWNDDLFRTWGQTIGRMHALTKDFRPSSPACLRHNWYDDGDLRAEKFLPRSQTLVLEKHRQLMDYLRSLPTDRDSYGLVHEDLHHGNFFVHKGEITAFDFDDSQYHFFASDVSIPLFYVLRNESLNDSSPEFARRFFGCLLEGYARENSLDRSWLELIPHFLKLREMILYVIIYAENAHEVNDWCRQFMDGRRERIENDVPVIDLDFGQFG